MSCEVEKHDGTIHISGDMTIYSAAALKDGLIAAMADGAGECRVDVSRVSEVDTCGLQLLLLMRRSCAAASRDFTLLNPGDALREVLELLHLDPVLRAGAMPATTGATA